MFGTNNAINFVINTTWYLGLNWLYLQAFYFANRLMYVSVFIDFVSISVYYTSLFVGDVNSLLMVSTKTTKIEPPRNIMISQYCKRCCFRLGIVSERCYVWFQFRLICFHSYAMV